MCNQKPHRRRTEIQRPKEKGEKDKPLNRQLKIEQHGGYVRETNIENEMNEYENCNNLL